MTARITFEVVQLGGAHSVTVRGVWQPYGQQLSVQQTFRRSVVLPDGVNLDESGLFQLGGTLCADIRGWQAPLPFD